MEAPPSSTQINPTERKRGDIERKEAMRT